MNIAVVEMPEDDAPELFFIDTTKLDPTNPIHAEYLRVVTAAAARKIKYESGLRYDHSLCSSDGHAALHGALVTLPATIHDGVRIRLDG